MNQKQFLLTLLVAVISAFLGGTLGVWFLMPQSVLAQDGIPKVIKAETFTVVDEKGRVYANLNAAGLFIFDPPNLMPGARYEYMGVRLEAENGRVRLSRDGFLVMESYDESLRLSVRSLDLKNREPNISLQDIEGNVRAVLGTTQLKHPDTGSTEIRAPSSLVLFDEEGNVVWSAP